MSKHTPGPWHASPVPVKRERYAADIYKVGTNVAEVFSKADAQLISAAPELLDVAVRALEVLEAVQAAMVHCPPPAPLEPIPALRAAIKKATEPQ